MFRLFCPNKLLTLPYPVFFKLLSFAYIIFDNKVQNIMPNKWSKSFGSMISMLRAENNLPLRKVAAELDIDTSTLSKIEKGERQASLDMIPIVAKLFGKDFKELQVQFLADLLQEEFEKEEFFIEALEQVVKKLKGKNAIR
ncbi:MAG: helix-turn-helix transcriptional regulator [Chitinophagaceae bacterium]|nr:helix-turn-helix transcriptional regulator [Chitinophagaceae bacterium]